MWQIKNNIFNVRFKNLIIQTEILICVLLMQSSSRKQGNKFFFCHGTKADNHHLPNRSALCIIVFPFLFRWQKNSLRLYHCILNTHHIFIIIGDFNFSLWIFNPKFIEYRNQSIWNAVSVIFMLSWISNWLGWKSLFDKDTSQRNLWNRFVLFLLLEINSKMENKNKKLIRKLNFFSSVQPLGTDIFLCDVISAVSLHPHHDNHCFQCFYHQLRIVLNKKSQTKKFLMRYLVSHSQVFKRIQWVNHFPWYSTTHLIFIETNGRIQPYKPDSKYFYLCIYTNVSISLTNDKLTCHEFLHVDLFRYSIHDSFRLIFWISKMAVQIGFWLKLNQIIKIKVIQLFYTRKDDHHSLLYFINKKEILFGQLLPKNYCFDSQVNAAQEPLQS